MPYRRLTSLLVLLIAANVASADAKRDALWAAVRAGDVAALKAAVEKGADVNARNEYGVTALWIAAEKGNSDVVKFLVGHGADVNARDDIWYVTPLTAFRHRQAGNRTAAHPGRGEGRGRRDRFRGRRQ